MAAISGGRDSVVLLDVLCALQKKLGFTLYAAHVNHGIRENAARDEAFVKDLCNSYGVVLLCESMNVPKIRELSGESLEEAARRLRYDALKNLAQDCHASCILTAHHASDQTETVLMGLVRGSFGMLHGMAEETCDARGRLLRPMLSVTREDIDRYAQAQNLCWCEDETNADVNFLRNRLRHETLVQLKAMNASLDTGVGQLAHALQRDEDFILSQVKPLLDSYIKRDGEDVLMMLDLAHVHEALRIRVVEHVLQDLGISCSQAARQSVCDLFLMQTGKQIVLSQDDAAIREKSGVRICKKQQACAASFFIQKTGSTVTPWGTFTCTGPTRCIDPYTDPNCQWIGEDLIENLFVCLPTSGMRMQPMGLGAQKLLSDIMCDAGLDTFARSRTPVVCDAAGPLWVVGCRADERLRLKANQKAYLLEFHAILKE
ncbi:MAG: tRNA lysidine(34) synthetase TilS [Clostridia bacterium]|nr:tRNA lysidine(34) synthetase TilS [Clostridia bacterium]